MNLVLKILFLLKLSFGLLPEPWEVDPPEGYRLEYLDDFNELNLAYWHKGLWWALPPPSKQVDENIAVVDGELVITLTKLDSVTYGAANLISKRDLPAYCLVRALVRWDSSPGLWVAPFWLFGSGYEYDLEACGGDPNRVSFTAHKWGKGIHEQTKGNAIRHKKLEPTKKYYLLEIEKTPRAIYWKVNGVTVKRVKKWVVEGEQLLIIGAGAGTYCTLPATTPAKLYMDYMEIYYKDEKSKRSGKASRK